MSITSNLSPPSNAPNQIPSPKQDPKLTPEIFLSSFFVGLYIFNGERMAAKTRLAQLYSNNVKTANKHALMRIQPFNRKFLKSEIEHFLHNENVVTKGPKRYTYNKYVHGADEEAHKKRFAVLNGGSMVFGKKEIGEIREMNRDKLEAGEQIRLVNWRINDHLDPTGALFEFEHFI